MRRSHTSTLPSFLRTKLKLGKSRKYLARSMKLISLLKCRRVLLLPRTSQGISSTSIRTSYFRYRDFFLNLKGPLVLVAEEEDAVDAAPEVEEVGEVEAVEVGLEAGLGVVVVGLVVAVVVSEVVEDEEDTNLAESGAVISTLLPLIELGNFRASFVFHSALIDLKVVLWSLVTFVLIEKSLIKASTLKQTLSFLAEDCTGLKEVNFCRWMHYTLSTLCNRVFKCA